MSILLRPDFEPRFASMLTLVMGLSVAQAVKELEVDVSIKWPNDVVVSRKKICGILTEMGIEEGKIREVVIGVGINVNLAEIQEELKDKATSLYLETGKTYDRNLLIGLVKMCIRDSWRPVVLSVMSVVLWIFHMHRWILLQK